MGKQHRRHASRKFRQIRMAIWMKLFYSVKLPGVCYWCERQLRFDQSTLDHVPPLSKGGHIRKGVISCEECNHQNRNHHSEVRIPDYLSNPIEREERNKLDRIWIQYLGKEISK